MQFRVIGFALATWAALSSSAPAGESRAHEPSPSSPGEGVGPAFLHPNVEDGDGTAGYVHVTEADMPLRIAIGFPKDPPRFGSREDARNAAIDAIRMWERAIQPHLEWFRLEFVKKDPEAAVQVVWKRRIAGPWAGFGWIRYWMDHGRLRVGGGMEVSTTPEGHTGLESRLRLEEIPVLFTHEFGHVLGLGHCLSCDSAMNYSWNTRGRTFVTDEDVRTFLALIAQPSGRRVDGRWLDGVQVDASP
ncbi:MAG: matrixin family metalloprotease [Myxococcota bacterium]